jgi:hypothetical protein
MLDAGVLDLQASVIIDDTSLPRGYDLDGNRDVDYSDRVHWLHYLRKTWVGDANLDLEFNSSDMVQIFATGKYETGEDAGWAEGDWDANLEFNSSDMVAAFADGGYEKGPQPPAVAVPEPTSILLLVMGLTGLVTFRLPLGW